MPSIRILRLQKELNKVITQVFAKKIRDKRLLWVSIKEIRLSPDMKYMKIYYSNLDGTIPLDVLQKLIVKTSGVIKKEIASLKLMRVIPDIAFHYDDSEDKVDRLSELFNQIQNESQKDEESNDN